MGDLAYVSLCVPTWFFTQLWHRMSYGYNKEKTNFEPPPPPENSKKCKNMLWYFHENTTNAKWRSQLQLTFYNSDFMWKKTPKEPEKNNAIACTMCASMKDNENTSAHAKAVYFLQFLTPMIHHQETMQSGGTARSVQRDLIALTNRSSCRRSPIFSHWSDRGIVRFFFCYSAVWRAVQAPSLPIHILCIYSKSYFFSIK